MVGVLASNMPDRGFESFSDQIKNYENWYLLHERHVLLMDCLIELEQSCVYPVVFLAPKISYSIHMGSTIAGSMNARS